MKILSHYNKLMKQMRCSHIFDRCGITGWECIKCGKVRSGGLHDADKTVLEFYRDEYNRKKADVRAALRR